MDLNDKCNDPLFLIRKITKLLNCNLTKELETLGLTAQQGRVLLFIGGLTCFKKENIHQKDIEEMLELSKSTVSGLMDRLEEKELINRIPVSNSCNIVLTEKAISMLKEIEKNRAEHRASVLQNITDEEKTFLINILNKIIDNLKGEEKC